MGGLTPPLLANPVYILRRDWSPVLILKLSSFCGAPLGRTAVSPNPSLQLLLGVEICIPISEDEYSPFYL